MKKSDPIVIPKGIEYIGNWEGYNLEDYNFPHILNKVLTGCGFTEYCIRNNQPLVLISPRVFLLKNKADQHQGAHEVFYVKNDVEKSVNFETDVNDTKPKVEKKDTETEESKKERIENLKHKIREYVNTCNANGITPKILVTYDSFRHVKEALGKSICFFQMVVDEFQSIFIDARFKSDTEIELLHQLQGINKVCYVSATPMLDKYLDMLPEFKDLPYYEFDWKTEDPGRVINPKLEVKFVRSLNDEAKKIIHSYQEGKFKTSLQDDGLVESKEAVIFMNSVSSICQAIRTNKLKRDECNILCANTDANNAKVRKAFNDVIKKEAESVGIKNPVTIGTKEIVVGEIPLEGEPHKMFTFCTRTVYLGADFYSTCARTFIFSDSNIDSLSVDISMDLEQILGRQRLKTNPWKNYADMFVKVTDKKHMTTKEEFDKKLEEKREKSIQLLNTYKEARDINKTTLAEAYQKLASTFHYKDDYVAVNEHAGKTLMPVFNNLMMVSEMRTFEVQQVDYKDRFSVFNAIGERKIEGIEKFIEEKVAEFNEIKNTIDRLKYLVKLSEEEIPNKDLEDFFSLIPPKYKEYYFKMGPDRIKANGYREDRLKEEWKKTHIEELGVGDDLLGEIQSYFKLGQRYTNPDIKAKLKELYAKYNHDKTAKASDLEDYFWLKKVYLPFEKKHGFEIIGTK